MSPLTEIVAVPVDPATTTTEVEEAVAVATFSFELVAVSVGEVVKRTASTATYPVSPGARDSEEGDKTKVGPEYTPMATVAEALWEPEVAVKVRMVFPWPRAAKDRLVPLMVALAIPAVEKLGVIVGVDVKLYVATEAFVVPFVGRLMEFFETRSFGVLALEKKAAEEKVKEMLNERPKLRLVALRPGLTLKYLTHARGSTRNSRIVALE